jgi:4-amino-4-deoxy-L-arabinose transferase-like glycosyltransferase
MLHLNLSYDTAFSESRQKQILQVMLLLIVALIVFISGISQLSFGDPDEGRYALISKNMVETGNYLEPRLGDHYYADKPPLYFWLTAASFKLLGSENAHFSARIVPIVGAILTILATYLIASTLFNHAMGMISAGGLLSTIAAIGLAKFIRMDIFLISFISLALWAFLKGYKNDGPSKWYLLMYPFLALGVLTKGPIALAIPAAVILLLLAWQTLLGRNEWKVLGHMRLIIGSAIVIVVAGPWFIYMERLHPGYAHEFFLNQNFNRAFQAGNNLGHHDNPLTNLAALFVAFVPWTGLVILGIARYLRSAFARQSTDWESRFLLLWFFFVLIFFSLSKTILIHYVFPAIVPGIILAARLVYDYWQSDFPRRRRQLTFAWAYPMILAVGGTMVLMYLAAAFGAIWLQFHEKWLILPDFYGENWWARWGWLLSTLYRLALAGVLVKVFWYLWRNWQMPQLVLAITASFLLLAVDLSYTDLPRMADLASARRLTPLVRDNSDPSTIILAGPNTKDQKWSLPFYLGSAYTVRQIPNLATLTDYYKNTDKIIYLATEADARQQVEWVLGDRIELLAQYRDMALLLIKPQTVGSENFSPANLESRPEKDPPPQG